MPDPTPAFALTATERQTITDALAAGHFDRRLDEVVEQVIAARLSPVAHLLWEWEQDQGDLGNDTFPIRNAASSLRGALFTQPGDSTDEGVHVHPDTNRRCTTTGADRWFYTGVLECYRQHDQNPSEETR